MDNSRCGWLLEVEFGFHGSWPIFVSMEARHGLPWKFKELPSVEVTVGAFDERLSWKFLSAGFSDLLNVGYVGVDASSERSARARTGSSLLGSVALPLAVRAPSRPPGRQRGPAGGK